MTRDEYFALVDTAIHIPSCPDWNRRFLGKLALLGLELGPPEKWNGQFYLTAPLAFGPDLAWPKDYWIYPAARDSNTATTSVEEAAR